MRIIKSTRKHKMHSLFPYIAEYDLGGLKETLEFGAMCMAFQQRFGPCVTSKWDEPTQFNQHWRKEVKVKSKRRRIYFKDMKDWTWAQLSK